MTSRSMIEWFSKVWFIAYVCSLYSFVYFHFVDVFATEMWTTSEGLKDPDLKKLDTNLPAIVLCYKATSTTKKYNDAYHCRREWASKHKLTVFPTNEDHVAWLIQNAQNQLWKKQLMH